MKPMEYTFDELLEIAEEVAEAWRASMTELAELGCIERGGYIDESRPRNAAEFGACWNLDAETAERKFAIYG